MSSPSVSELCSSVRWSFAVLLLVLGVRDLDRSESAFPKDVFLLLVPRFVCLGERCIDRFVGGEVDERGGTREEEKEERERGEEACIKLLLSHL